MDEFDREECMNPENKPYHHEGCPYNDECAVKNSIDKKNVIKGLEVCVDRDPGKYTCDQCPYENDGNDCEIHLTHDAIALLKEQQREIEILKAMGLKMPEITVLTDKPLYKIET